MKKIIMSTMAALAMGMTANAYVIYVDIEGKLSTTINPDGSQSMSCDNSVGCCATIVIYCSVQQTPTQGDLTVVRECDGTSFQNIIHQWQGSYQSSSITSGQNGTRGTITIYDEWQDF